MTRNLYDLLGVGAGASAEEIHRAYRRLARRYHPDMNVAAGADVRFKEVLGAYEVLRDPEQRASYDRSATRPVVRRRSTPRPAGPRAPYFSDAPTRDVPRFVGKATRVVVSVRVSWLPRFLERWL
jgi:DnaJ-class molecular chaperone